MAEVSDERAAPRLRDAPVDSFEHGARQTAAPFPLLGSEKINFLDARADDNRRSHRSSTVRRGVSHTLCQVSFNHGVSLEPGCALSHKRPRRMSV